MYYKNSRGEVVHDYVAEEYRRKLTFKLKNAIMAKWLEIKESKTKLNFDEIIKGLQEKKRLENEDAVAFKENKKRERKEKRENKRKEALEKQKEEESKFPSYINKDQYKILYESIMDINKKIYDHSQIVDEIESKLLEVNEKRKKRKEKNKN